MVTPFEASGQGPEPPHPAGAQSLPPSTQPIPVGPPPRPSLIPPRPRPVADILIAIIALLVLGLPSLVLVSNTFNPMYFIFGIQYTFAFSGLAQFIGSGVTVAAALGMPLAMIWRATHPVAATSAVYLLALAHFLTGSFLMPVDLVIFLALYSVTIYGPSWASKLGMIGAFLGALLITFSFVPAGEGLQSAVVGAILFGFSATLVLLAWGAGLLRRSRLEQRETLRERALRLERERDQQAQIATVAERNRIAREMHDIVAHSLSVVVAQADGGRYAAGNDPAAATRALETIAETSRAALADMRRILGVLRDENGDPAALIPQPADTDIATLIAQVKAAGLSVSHVSIGAPRALPPGAGVAVYRIVQESLTNVLKHGGPQASAIVTTAWESAGLTVTVDDDGRGAAATSDGAGHGLVGMRERATMLGGSLTAGPRPGGGFRVQFHIPLPR